MIRPTTPDDTTALIAIAKATGLFDPSALDLVNKMLTEYFSNSDSQNLWFTDDDNEPVGMAYCEPERMTHQTWNLQLIAIRPDRQRQGRGALLLRYVEHALTQKDGRILLAETSGVPSFESTREFYRKCGYQEEARIRDFYEAGDDKIVYRKVLSAQEQ